MPTPAPTLVRVNEFLCEDRLAQAAHDRLVRRAKGGTPTVVERWVHRVVLGLAAAVAIAGVGLAEPGPGIARVEAACPVGQVCVPVPKPDLVVAVTVAANGTPRVTVRNAGTANAGAFSVAGTSNTSMTRQWTSAGLAPGASQSFGGDTPADLARIARCGTRWTVTVDAGNAVAESSESNNTTTGTNHPCDR
jgi:CARDB